MRRDKRGRRNLPAPIAWLRFTPLAAEAGRENISSGKAGMALHNFRIIYYCGTGSMRAASSTPAVRILGANLGQTLNRRAWRLPVPLVHLTPMSLRLSSPPRCCTWATYPIKSNITDMDGKEGQHCMVGRTEKE